MGAASALWVLAGVAAVAALPNGMLPPDEAHPAHAHLRVGGHLVAENKHSDFQLCTRTFSAHM